MEGFCESPLFFDPDLYYEYGADNSTDFGTGNSADFGTGLNLSSSPAPLGEIGNRLAQEPCFSHAECARGHCAHVTEPMGSCEKGEESSRTNSTFVPNYETNSDGKRDGCICMDAPVCTFTSEEKDEDCLPGEVCTVLQDQIVQILGIGIAARCMSLAVMNRRRPFLVVYTDPSPSPSPSISIVPTPSVSPSKTASESSSGVCIDAQVLLHIEEASLVYPRDSQPRASVLCDQNGSCATPGHMVTWNGRPMIMRRYCSEVTEVQCIGKVMHVNSPKMSLSKTAGRRIGSKTGGLLFTSLAARYETLIEEKMLGVLVRLGV